MLLFIFLLIIFWIIPSIVCGIIGSEREIGGVAGFCISFFLSPLIGLIVVLVSKKKGNAVQTWDVLIEKGDIELFKGNKKEAVDKYKEALYWLTEARKKYAHSPNSLNIIDSTVTKVNTKIGTIEENQ